MALTLSTAQTNLDAAVAAHAKALDAASYEIKGRNVSRQNLGALQKAIDFWEKKVSQLSKSNGRNVTQKGITIIYDN